MKQRGWDSYTNLRFWFHGLWNVSFVIRCAVQSQTHFVTDYRVLLNHCVWLYSTWTSSYRLLVRASWMTPKSRMTIEYRKALSLHHHHFGYFLSLLHQTTVSLYSTKVPLSPMQRLYRGHNLSHYLPETAVGLTLSQFDHSLYVHLYTELIVVVRIKCM